MDNKSELSKPVAYSLRFRNMNGEPDKTINANTTFSTLEKAKAYGLGSRYVTQDDGKIVSVRDPSQDPIVEPLYSQEYVSALLARIAELEAIRADASQVFKEIGTQLGCNPDNESIMMAIDELKATQVTGPLALIIKRAEEMERILEGITPEMIAGGWTAKGISDYAKSLEAKLATPVRLKKVDSSNVPYAGDGFNAAVDYCADRVRAAGFTVQGDE